MFKDPAASVQHVATMADPEMELIGLIGLIGLITFVVGGLDGLD